MAKTASVFTRVDPKIKEQAESVLDQLGISMSTAMEIYLRQIAMHRKIPFEMALPDDKPKALGALSDEQFNALMEQSVDQYKEGNSIPASEVESAMHRKYGI